MGFLERRTGKLGRGNLVGVVCFGAENGGVVPGIVYSREDFEFVEFGFRRETLWVDTGAYQTAVFVGDPIQLPMLGLEAALYDRIAARSSGGLKVKLKI